MMYLQNSMDLVIVYPVPGNGLALPFVSNSARYFVSPFHWKKERFREVK